MECNITEKTYTGDDYCFSVAETTDCFTVSICSSTEYFQSNRPEFVLVDIYQKIDGWNTEKIENLINDEKFLFDAVKIYTDLLLTSRKSRKVNEEYQSEKIVSKIKEVVQTSSATCWTLEEASKYSHIGINRLREESLKDDCPWVLWIGDTKRIVKVDTFKAWLNKLTSII